ncbi:MAG: response regulator [Campylobacterota bacterium]|nr:response regulator [Campylobacterota bacterium]
MPNKLVKEVKELAKGVKVLYAEDEELARETMSDILKSLFDDVVIAVDGFDALEMLELHKNIDIIITDIKMPNMDGIELIKNIRQKDEWIPILVLSAHSDAEYFLKTIKYGIEGYIIKPIETKQFFKEILKPLHKIAIKKENEAYRSDLENKVTREISKRKYQEKILFQQSKLAAMGEMIDAVAHQWKQPLGIMNMHTDMLEFDYEDGNIDEEYIKEHIKKFKTQMNHALNTLEEFRAFFRPSTKDKEFYISSVIDSTLLLVKDEFVKNKIEFIINIEDDTYIKGNPNEFKHLILNIINNSKDAFIEKDIQNRKISINLYINDENKKLSLEIKDNARGIKEDVLKDIFKPNITTKPEGKGTGIGLYMSYQIASKLNATLKARSIDDGAVFIFQKRLL